MASQDDTETGRRKKRAWRKPPEPVTPASDPTPAKPIKLQRTGNPPPRPSPPPGLTSPASGPASKGAAPMGAPQRQDVPTSRHNACKPQGGDPDALQGGGALQGPFGGGAHQHGNPLIHVDGSIKEGGGQILRIATALGCILTRPLHVTQIRAGRDKPGLRPQHMTGIKLLGDMCGGRLEGVDVGSCELTLHPQAINGGEYLADTKTAGSICLLIQVALPVLLFAKRTSRITLRGGTNADMAPPIDYMTMIFRNIAARFGVKFDCQLKKRGFFPKGRGEVVVTCSPVKSLSAVELTDPGQVKKIRIHAFTAGAVPMKACHQMVQSAHRVLKDYFLSIEEMGVVFEEDKVRETPDTAFGNSSGIMLVAETTTGCLLASSANGRQSVAASLTGATAAEELVKNLREGGCVDEHLQDQLVILMALAHGTSRVRTGSLTLHTETAIHISQLVTNGKAKFKVEKLADKGNIIHCEGMGLER